MHLATQGGCNWNKNFMYMHNFALYARMLTLLLFVFHPAVTTCVGRTDSLVTIGAPNLVKRRKREGYAHAQEEVAGASVVCVCQRVRPMVHTYTYTFTCTYICVYIYMYIIHPRAYPPARRCESGEIFSPAETRKRGIRGEATCIHPTSAYANIKANLHKYKHAHLCAFKCIYIYAY